MDTAQRVRDAPSMSACFSFLNHALGLGLAHAFRPVAGGVSGGRLRIFRSLPFTSSLDQTRQEDRVNVGGRKTGKQVP